jgi:hypothetical protein
MPDMTFHIGQRVGIVPAARLTKSHITARGTVIGMDPTGCVVRLDDADEAVVRSPYLLRPLA